MSGAVPIGGERRGRGEPRTLTWGKNRAQLLQGQSGGGVRLIDVAVEPDGTPQSWAIVLSFNQSFNQLVPALPVPTYTIRIGIGDDWYEWRAMPPPAIGAAYIVHAHNVQVDAEPSLVGPITVSGWACPTDAVPTLTP